MSKKLIGMALATASLLAYAAATDGARASTFTVNVTQVGPNVVMNGSGTLDTNALAFVNPFGVALSTTPHGQYTWLSHADGPLLCHDY
jgi:hypothetical protein